jgi:hypothetical protein
VRVILFSSNVAGETILLQIHWSGRKKRLRVGQDNMIDPHVRNHGEFSGRTMAPLNWQIVGE